MDVNNLVIGKRYMYLDPIEEKYYNVILIGLEGPDEDGDIFAYYKADEVNEYGANELNEYTHPAYEKYWLILHILDQSIIDPDQLRYEEDMEQNEYINQYYNN